MTAAQISNLHRRDDYGLTSPRNDDQQMVMYNVWGLNNKITVTIAPFELNE